MKTIHIHQKYYGKCDRCHEDFPDIPLIQTEGRLFCESCAKVIADQVQEVKLGDLTKILFELDIKEHLSSAVAAGNAARTIIEECDFLSLPREQRTNLIHFARELSTELSKVDRKKLFSATQAIEINRLIKQGEKSRNASEKSATKNNATPQKRGRKKQSPQEMLAKLGLTNIKDLIAQAKKG